MATWETRRRHERVGRGQSAARVVPQAAVGSGPPAGSADGQPARLLTIGRAARRSGFTVRALRFYERRGLLPPSGRRPGGYRLYSETDLHRLEFIRQAKALGLTLESIRELVVAARGQSPATARPRLLRVLEERIAQTARQIAGLTRLRQEFERRRRALARRPPAEPGRGYCACLHDSASSCLGPGTSKRSAAWRRSARTDGRRLP